MESTDPNLAYLVNAIKSVSAIPCPHNTSVFSVSLFNIHANTQKNTRTKEKSDCFHFHPWPPPFLPLQLCSLSKRFTCSFLSGSLMRRVSYSVDITPALFSHCTNTADGRRRRCHDTVAWHLNKSPSIHQQAGPQWARACL